ncbi:VCBS domain-containing protein, partial [Rhodocyclus purpureus]|uniref:VCBS domain-containing protein n=1 Tax=Rhodocyclus purpureus TaxID=1067 RepID=UPI0019113958
MYVQRAEDSVYEAGLPQGSQSGGSSAAVGTIDFTAVHGFSEVSMAGHVLTTTPQSFDGLFGELTAWYSYDPVAGTGSISYRYTLTGTTSGDNTADSFPVVLSDALGNTTINSLTINIVDDVPTARPDVAGIGEDATGVITGTVIANDTYGADGVPGSKYVTGVTAGTQTTEVIGGVAGDIEGSFGKLALQENGSYTYTLYAASDSGSAATLGYKALQALSANETQPDTFSYTIKDADGDFSTTTLTITVTGVNDAPVITVVDVAGTVKEDTATIADNPNTQTVETGAYLSDTGSVTFTDADATDLSDASVAIKGTAVASTGASVSTDLATALSSAMALSGDIA